MYETLFLHESSTASQEERALSESKMRTLFLESLENRPGHADGAPAAPPNVSPTHALSQPGQVDDYTDASGEYEVMLGEHEEEGPTKSQRIQGEHNIVPHVRCFSELTENSRGESDSESDVQL
jgi:hypothetical protein